MTLHVKESNLYLSLKLLFDNKSNFLTKKTVYFAQVNRYTLHKLIGLLCTFLWNSLLTIRVTFWQVKQTTLHFSLKLLVANKINFLTSETDYFAPFFDTPCWQGEWLLTSEKFYFAPFFETPCWQQTFWQVKQSPWNSLLTSDTVYFAYTLKLLVDNKSNFLTSETVFLQLAADKWYGLLCVYFETPCWR